MKTTEDKETAGLKKQLLAKRTPSAKPTSGLSTGSTLLNLACSGNPGWGLAKGGYYLFVGDTDSGKTFISLTCLAEACHNIAFNGYRIIFDNAENGALMDIEKYFGKKTAARLEPPRTAKDGTPIYSVIVDDFYFHVDDAIKEGTPFIYILDSVDALDTKEGLKKFAERKAARRKDRIITGEMNMEKAKANSGDIRKIYNQLVGTKSILIIINQSRQKIGFGAMPGSKTRAGGYALEFYATCQIWYAKKDRLLKPVPKLGKDLQIGIRSKVRVKRSRITGKDRTVEIPILWSSGIDDIGSCVDFLIEWKHWKTADDGDKKKDKGIDATEFKFKGSREALIRHIEDTDGGERELRSIVAETWEEIEEACQSGRKMRYE